MRLTKDVLRGPEYLHDECKVIYSDIFYASFAVVIGRSDFLTDSKPGNALLLPSDEDNVITHILIEELFMVYDFLKTVTPDQRPVYPAHSPPRFRLSPIRAMVRLHDANYGQTIKVECSAAIPKKNT